MRDHKVKCRNDRFVQIFLHIAIVNFLLTKIVHVRIQRRADKSIKTNIFVVRNLGNKVLECGVKEANNKGLQGNQTK